MYCYTYVWKIKIECSYISIYVVQIITVVILFYKSNYLMLENLNNCIPLLIINKIKYNNVPCK